MPNRCSIISGRVGYGLNSIYDIKYSLVGDEKNFKLKFPGTYFSPGSRKYGVYMSHSKLKNKKVEHETSLRLVACIDAANLWYIHKTRKWRLCMNTEGVHKQSFEIALFSFEETQNSAKCQQWFLENGLRNAVKQSVSRSHNLSFYNSPTFVNIHWITISFHHPLYDVIQKLFWYCVWGITGAYIIYYWDRIYERV